MKYIFIFAIGIYLGWTTGTIFNYIDVIVVTFLSFVTFFYIDMLEFFEWGKYE